MREERKAPDAGLLAAGWERRAETDEYRLPGQTGWLSAEQARALVSMVSGVEVPGTVEQVELTAEPEREVDLLIEILAELKKISVRLDRLLARRSHGE